MIVNHNKIEKFDIDQNEIKIKATDINLQLRTNLKKFIDDKFTSFRQSAKNDKMNKEEFLTLLENIRLMAS